MVPGKVSKTWDYDESCQEWKGELRRAVMIGAEEVAVQTLVDGTVQQGCIVKADRDHNVFAVNTLVSAEAARKLWIDGAGETLPGSAVVAIDKRVSTGMSERFARRVAALRAQGVSGRALDLEAQRLSAIFVEKGPPGLEPFED